jgi:hypothetical protein
MEMEKQKLSFREWVAYGLLLSFLFLTVWHTQHVLSQYEEMTWLAWLLAGGLEAGLAFASFVILDRTVTKWSRIVAGIWLGGLIIASYGLNVVYYLSENAGGWSWALAALFPASIAFLGAIMPGLKTPETKAVTTQTLTLPKSATTETSQKPFGSTPAADAGSNLPLADLSKRSGSQNLQLTENKPVTAHQNLQPRENKSVTTDRNLQVTKNTDPQNLQVAEKRPSQNLQPNPENLQLAETFEPSNLPVTKPSLAPTTLDLSTEPIEEDSGETSPTTLFSELASFARAVQKSLIGVREFDAKVLEILTRENCTEYWEILRTMARQIQKRELGVKEFDRQLAELLASVQNLSTEENA